jgi:hypothetical protein
MNRSGVRMVALVLPVTIWLRLSFVVVETVSLP